AVLCFGYETRGESLWNSSNLSSKNQISFSMLFGVLSILTLAIAALLSLIASDSPDGLEWSLEKVTGATELESQGKIYENLSKLQEFISLLPDYTFKDSQSPLGTSFSGIIGSLIVLCLCILACYFFRIFKAK
ncbi:MAG: PDGLE domain-containing protein, partial [Helicobacter sp.]|nr:PDGLE domain-containing protein [Helicobacter sp.]